MGGWSWDGDDVDPRAQLEAENGGRQARRLLDLIASALEDPSRFDLTTGVICELTGIAMTGLTDNPGKLRARDVEIVGSRHEPPTWQSLPSLIDQMCLNTN